MELLNFKCINCKIKIKKIKSIKDIFLLKTGKKIICQECNTKYGVPKPIAIISKIYYYSLVSGIVPLFIWLSLSIYLDNILDSIFGSGTSNQIGIWMFLISALVYVFIEFVIVVLLPLKEKKD